MKRATIARAVSLTGVGLHSGAAATVTVHPAAAGTGRVFWRPGVASGSPIPALASHVAATNHRTVLRNDHQTVSTVEHALAAAASLAIDDVMIETTGPELPIGDGSALDYVDLFVRAGRTLSAMPGAPLTVHQPFEVEHAGSRYAVTPARHLQLTVGFRMQHPLVGHQQFDITITPASFRKDLAGARTFGLVRDHERLKTTGLALGANATNVIALTETGLHTGALRWPDEFVRHKTLDLVGDLALVGRPILAHITATQPGHGGNVELARALNALALQQVEAGWTSRQS